MVCMVLTDVAGAFLSSSRFYIYNACICGVVYLHYLFACDILFIHVFQLTSPSFQFESNKQFKDLAEQSYMHSRLLVSKY